MSEEQNKQTAMYDFLVHLRLMKNQLQREYQNQRADYYMVRILEGLELKAYGFLAQEKEQIEEAYNTTYGFTDGQEYYEKTYGNNN